MVATSQVLDEYVIETVLADKSSAGADQASSALDRLEKQAQATGAAVRAAGQATEETGARVTTAASIFDRYAARADDVTRAHNALTRAQETLRAAQAAANREMASGSGDAEQIGRTLAALTQKVSAAAEKLGDARAAAEANAAATDAWNASLGEGATAIATYAQGVAQAAQASKEAENAAQSAAAAQAEFNKVLGVNASGAGYKDAAASAADLGAALDQLRSKHDPLFAASKRYEAGLEEIAQAQKLGGLTAAQAEAAVERLTSSYASANAPLEAYGQKVSAAAKVSEAAAQNAAAAQAEFNRILGVNTSGAGYKDAAASAAALGSEMDRLRAKYDPLFAASKQYEAGLAEIVQAQKLGVLTASQAEAAQTRLTNEYAKANDPLRQVEKGSGAAAAATRNLGIQVTQAVSGIATGQPVLTTLIQQGHQVFDSSLAMGTGFGGVATAAKGMFAAVGGVPTLIAGAVLAAFVGLTSAAENQAVRLGDVRQQLRATHDDYAALATSAEAAARRVAATTTESLGQAQAAAQTIAGAKYFAGTTADLTRLTAMSGDLARVWKTDVPTAAARLRDAINDPAAAARKFGEEGMTAFSGINAGVVTSVEGLQRAGNTAGAFALVLKGLGTVSAGATQDQSKLSGAVHDLQTAMFGAQDGSKSFATSIGEVLTVPVVGAVRLLTGLVEVLKAVKDAAVAIPSIGSKISALAAQGGVDNDGMPVGSATGQAASVSSAARLTASASQQDFINTWGGAAQMAGKELGISATTVLGQWAAESGWGKSLYGFNAGNIKAQPGYTGASQTLPDGLQYRAYASPEEYAKDYVAVLKADRYAAVRNTGSNVAATANGLQQAGYMENPSGANLIVNTAASVRARAPDLDTGGMVDNATALNDQLAKQVENTRALKDVQIAQELQKVGAQMDAVAASAGKDSDQYKGLVQRQQELTAEFYKNVDAQTEANRASESALRANAGLTAAEVALNAALEQRRQLALNTGAAFTDTDAAKVAADLTAKQVQELGRLNFSMANTAANSIQMARAYDDGNQSVVDATAKQAAYNQALTMFVPGSDAFRTAYKQLVDGYKQVALAAAEAQVAQQNATGRDNLAYIAAETSSLGMNEDARTKLLAVMRAEQEMHRKFGDDLPAEAQQYIKLTAAQADATAGYARQKASLDELTGFFDHTFSTIADSITSAFATGELSAVKFGDIAKSGVSAVAAEFVKLALVNPLKNTLFGSNSTTLGSVGGLLGGLLGGSVSTAGAVIPAGSAAASLAGYSKTGLAAGPTQSGATLDTTAEGKASASLDIGTVGALGGLFAKLGGVKDSISSIGSYSLYSSTGGGLFGGGSSAAQAGPTLSGATLDTATGAASAGGAGVTLLQGAGILGGLYGAYSGIQRGGIGGAVGTVAGVAGAGLAAAGTGLLGAGAYAGAAALGPWAPLAIGALGLLSAFLPGAHPKNPYQDTAVDIKDGQVVIGKQVAQLESLDNATTRVNSFADAVNTYTKQVGIVITNPDGNLGHVGEKIKGLSQEADVSTLFNRLRFDTDSNAADASTNFGIARHAVAGMAFETPDALNDELVKIATFSAGLDALRIHLAGVGQDLNGIQIASVDLTDAMGQGSDLRTALAHDLPGQIFANQDALSAEIEKVNQFVNGTIPGLLAPVLKTSSSFIDSIAAINKTYEEAAAQAEKYGLDKAPILAAQKVAANLLYDPARQALDQAAEGRANASIAASLADPTTKFEAQQRDAAIAAAQQREALIKSMKEVYNDAVTSTDYYWDQLETYDDQVATAAMTRAAVFARQQKTASLSLAASLAGVQAREEVLAGNQLGAALANFDAKAAQELDSFGNSLADFYGERYRESIDYQESMTQLERVQQGERLAIVTQTTAAMRAQSFSLADTRAGIVARALSATGNDKAGELLSFDVKARQERDAYQAQFDNLYGTAYEQTADYQTAMTELVTVQEAERYAIIKKYGEATTTETASALSQARTNVGTLFTSLNAYVNKLQTGSDSPLSSQDQYALARSRFNAVAGAAVAGDYRSANELQGYADTFLSTSRAVNGSGAGYAADFQRVIDTVAGVSTQAETLTVSDQREIMQDTANQITASIEELQATLVAALDALRREQAQATRLANAA